MGSKDSDFAPKIFILGRHNTIVSPLIELVVKEEQNRFGVRSAGIEPTGQLNREFVEFFNDYDPDLELEEFGSNAISSVLNDHVQLVAYLSETIQREAPIIATTGESITLETEPYREQLADDPTLEDYYQVIDEIRESTLPKILEPLGLD